MVLQYNFSWCFTCSCNFYLNWSLFSNISRSCMCEFHIDAFHFSIKKKIRFECSECFKRLGMLEILKNTTHKGVVWLLKSPKKARSWKKKKKLILTPYPYPLTISTNHSRPITPSRQRKLKHSFFVRIWANSKPGHKKLRIHTFHLVCAKQTFESTKIFGAATLRCIVCFWM